MVVIRVEQNLLLSRTIRQVTRDVRMIVERVRMHVSVAKVYRVK
jgi:hypothetical protein